MRIMQVKRRIKLVWKANEVKKIKVAVIFLVFWQNFLAKFTNSFQGQLTSTSRNENRGHVIQQRVLYKVKAPL